MRKGKKEKEETKLRILEVIASLHLPSLVIKYNFNKHSIMTELCSRDPIFHSSRAREGVGGDCEIFSKRMEEKTPFSIEKSVKRFMSSRFAEIFFLSLSISL